MYITHAACISPQPTFDERFAQAGETAFHEGTKYHAIEPCYGATVPLPLLRRMSKAMRMIAGLGMPIIRTYNRNLEGIFLGTVPASTKQSVHFLQQLKRYTNGLVSSRDFAQFTAQSIAGSLALLGRVAGTHRIHMEEGIAFEQALLEALTQLEQGRGSRLLVGGVEALTETTYETHLAQGRVKSVPTTSATLLQAGGQGTAWGEGAAMFVVEATPSKRAKARIVDARTCCFGSPEQVAGELRNLLQHHYWSPTQVQGLVLGYNGDASTDVYYDEMTKQLFPKAGVWTYKQLMGDSAVANAFGCWLGVQVLQGANLPEATIWRKPTHEPNRIVLYNHYGGTQHGMILMEATGE